MIKRMLTIWFLVPLPFSKTSVNIWKFTVHVLLKPGLENFEARGGGQEELPHVQGAVAARA